MTKKPAAKTPPESPEATASQDPKKAQEAKAPSIHVIVQYIKDFSFENPRAPESLRAAQESPTINININVNANPVKAAKSGDPEPKDTFEVELKIEASAERGSEKMFFIELAYSGVFRLENIAQENIAPVILVECPRMLFPFARQIIAEATRNGGFPPLLIDPVDFAALFQQRIEMEKNQAQAATTH